MERGRPPPSWALQRPEVEPAAEPYWTAWWALHAHREVAVGMAGIVEQPIAYSEAAAYARDHGLADTLIELDEFLRLMRAMDAVFRKHAAQERSEKAAEPSKEAQ